MIQLIAPFARCARKGYARAEQAPATGSFPRFARREPVAGGDCAIDTAATSCLHINCYAPQRGRSTKEMISATEFYSAFLVATDNFAKSDNSKFQKKEWTKRMFGKNGILDATVENLADKEIVLWKEFYLYDGAILDTSPSLPYNKIKYRQPTNVLALIEHENGPNPEEEFWKLLHFYSKLKVLIFYSQSPEKLIEGFKFQLDLVSDIHHRNVSEEYLCIVGCNFSAQNDWKACKMSFGKNWEWI